MSEHVLSLMLVSGLIALTNKVVVDYFTFRAVVFRVGFFVVMFTVAFAYLYAWVTPWKGAVWGTR